MNVYTELNREGYERVIRCDNKNVGFVAWIAVHSTILGPALGGCRVWNYESEDAALFDVLRLSKGMTYKNSLAGLPFGGGKSVVHTNLAKVDRIALFTEIGNFVEHLQGIYITAEDMNSTVEDMAIVQRRTSHVATVGTSGNPSPFTALGVYHAIRAAAKHRLQKDTLAGLTVALQGVGQTGGRLARMLYDDNCIIIAADVNGENIEQLARQIELTQVGPDEIYDVACDIFSPCAMGEFLIVQLFPGCSAQLLRGVRIISFWMKMMDMR